MTAVGRLPRLTVVACFAFVFTFSHGTYWFDLQVADAPPVEVATSPAVSSSAATRPETSFFIERAPERSGVSGHGSTGAGAAGAVPGDPVRCPGGAGRVAGFA